MEKKRYELCREIFNACSGNQMRDVSFEYVEIADTDVYMKCLYKDKPTECEREVLEDGTQVYHMNTAGLLERYSFTPDD